MSRLWWLKCVCDPITCGCAFGLIGRLTWLDLKGLRYVEWKLKSGSDQIFEYASSHGSILGPTQPTREQTKKKKKKKNQPSMDMLSKYKSLNTN